MSEGRAGQREAQPAKAQAESVQPGGLRVGCAEVTGLGRSAPLDAACPPCWGTCCCSPPSGPPHGVLSRAQARGHRAVIALCPECLGVLGSVQRLPSRSWPSRRSQGLRGDPPSGQSGGLTGWALQWDSKCGDLDLRAQREHRARDRRMRVCLSLIPSVLTRPLGGSRRHQQGPGRRVWVSTACFPTTEVSCAMHPTPFPTGSVSLSG